MACNGLAGRLAALADILWLTLRAAAKSLQLTLRDAAKSLQRRCKATGGHAPVEKVPALQLLCFRLRLVQRLSREKKRGSVSRV